MASPLARRAANSTARGAHNGDLHRAPGLQAYVRAAGTRRGRRQVDGHAELVRAPHGLAGPTTTELKDGSEVDDKEFTAAGWDYDIRIEFSTQRASTYRDKGGTITHERGWPPNAGAPAAGWRG